MSRRPIAIGSRVYTVFWNEITERDLGRGPANPITRRGTVLSGGAGKFVVRFEAAESADNNELVNAWRATGYVDVPVDAWNLHREGDPVDAIVRRTDRPWATGGHEHGPRGLWQRRWDHRTYVLYHGTKHASPYWARTEPEPLPFRAWYRKRRRFASRYDDVTAARKALAERAARYGADKRRDLFLAEALRTPMVFPPAHPGCDEPIYPILNAERTWFGDGWTCRTHGDVTESVRRTYYPPTPPPRRARARSSR